MGAFFHDVGHVVGERQGLERMVTGDVVLGVQHHAERGRDYLESLGVTGNVSKLVGMHVQAKRYLVATDQSYCKFVLPYTQGVWLAKSYTLLSVYRK